MRQEYMPHVSVGNVNVHRPTPMEPNLRFPRTYLWLCWAIPQQTVAGLFVRSFHVVSFALSAIQYTLAIVD